MEAISGYLIGMPACDSAAEESCYCPLVVCGCKLQLPDNNVLQVDSKSTHAPPSPLPRQNDEHMPRLHFGPVVAPLPYLTPAEAN